MSTVILSRVIDSVTDKRVVLANSQIARSIPFGTWNVLRIGIRCSVTDTGGNISGPAPWWGIGICQGLTNLLGDATTTGWGGVIFDTGGTWTRTAGPNPTFYTVGGLNSIGTGDRTGASLVFRTGLAYSVRVSAQPASGYRTMMFVDLIKASTEARAFFCTSTPADISQTEFLQTMVMVTPIFTGYTYTSAGFAIFPAGANAINIVWKKLSPVLEISDLAIAKIS